MIDITQQLLDVLRALKTRLAPDNATNRPVKFYTSSATAGTQQDVQLSGPYNAILVSLQQGTLNVYFGGYNPLSPPLIPDLVLNQSTNPIPIPFQTRHDKTVSFVVPANSQPVSGSVYLGYY